MDDAATASDLAKGGDAGYEDASSFKASPQ
jgi:hypothetical protein